MSEDIKRPRVCLPGLGSGSKIPYYEQPAMDVYLEVIEKQAETFRFLFSDEGVRTENLMKIQLWRDAKKKLEAIKILAPRLIKWVERGSSWDRFRVFINESNSSNIEAAIEQETSELVKQFRDLLGLEEEAER